MSFSKLKRIHVVIIGSVLCVIAIVGQFFLLIKPKNEAYAAAQARLNAAVSGGGTIEAQNAAIAARDAAIDEVRRVKADLQAQMERRMPDLSFARRDLGMLALWNENIRVLGPLLENYARDPNMINVNAQISIQPPPLDPNNAIFDSTTLVYPLGSVQVVGDSLKSVLNNIRRWNNCRRLVMVGPPVISGNSPQLSAAYSLTCYIFPQAVGGPPITMAGGGGGQQAGP